MPEAAPPFASEWDEALARTGPPAIFTLDPEGKLRVDPERTREIYLQQPAMLGRIAGHYVLTDRATGLRLYLFVTHAALAERQPRGEVVAYPDAASALRQTVEQWAVPAAEAPAGGVHDPG